MIKHQHNTHKRGFNSNDIPDDPSDSEYNVSHGSPQYSVAQATPRQASMHWQAHDMMPTVNPHYPMQSMQFHAYQHQEITPNPYEVRGDYHDGTPVTTVQIPTVATPPRADYSTPVSHFYPQQGGVMPMAHYALPQNYGQFGWATGSKFADSCHLTLPSSRLDEMQ